MVGDLAVVEEWLEAINDQDAARLEALSREQVVRYARHDRGVADALAAAGLDEQRDLVSQRG